MNTQLNLELRKLFDNNYFADDFDPEDNLSDVAVKLAEEYGWSDVYSWFFDYLTQECDTDVKVYNAINLFYVFGYEEYPIINPYELIGYIYYRIDLDEHWEEWGDFIDGFAIGILERCGKADLMKDPYYRSWEDKNVIAAVEEWRKKNEP